MKRKVKAWAVLTGNGKLVTVNGNLWVSEVKRKHLSAFTVPCTISYDLPTKERKRKV